VDRSLYMGINSDNFIAEGDPDTPVSDPAVQPKWYERILPGLVSAVGNVSYVDDDYTIRTQDGNLIVDLSARDTPPPAAPPPAAPGPQLPALLQQVPPMYWYVGGGILLLLILSRR